jgi:RNA polymerase sigma-70 factor (ECF subfamily)
MASMTQSPSRARHDDVDLERDRALVERCQAGDERAFEDLYLRYRERLYRYCLRRTKSTAEAEDLVQETFARAWKALPRFDGERRFYPWLSVIANNLCTDLARRVGRCTPVDGSDLDLMTPAQVPEQEQLVEAAGDGQILAQALGRLSPRHREVLELREGRNWSYQQIATHSGVEVSTIETLLFRARRSLRREFLTIARTDTGLAGLLALPFVAMRRALRRLKALATHAPAAAKLGGVTSATSGPGIAGGVAAAVTAAVITAGALVGTHASAAQPARSLSSAVAAATHGAGGGSAASSAWSQRRLVDAKLSGSGSSPAPGAGKAVGTAVVTGGPSRSGGSATAEPTSPRMAGQAGATVQHALSGATTTVTETVTGVEKTVTKTVSSAKNSVAKTVSSTTKTVKKVLKKLLGGLGTFPVSSISAGPVP